MRYFIKESVLTIKDFDFLRKNNINVDSISYAGKGDYGEAYYVNNNRILKITTSESEYQYAKKIFDKGNIPIFENFVNIYDVKKIDNVTYYILMEEVEEDQEIEILYHELLDSLSKQGLDILHLGSFDEEEYEGEMSDDFLEFMNELEDVVRAYKYLGVQNPDIRPENLGYAEDGTLKAFDIDEKG